MRACLAILKDSFREAAASRILTERVFQDGETGSHRERLVP